MDDQRTNRASGGPVTQPKRFRISLRLALLLMALFAVCFTWLGSLRQLQRTGIKAELDGLEHIRKYLAISPVPPGLEQVRAGRIEKLNADAAEKWKLLGE